MLIGLTGKAGSGKDTVFSRIERFAEGSGLPKPERIAFADPLKDSACRLLGISREDLEFFKTSTDSGHITVCGKPMSMRQFLQRYGTEAHRDVFGDDFWVDASLPKSMRHHGRILVVTDVRFYNESDRVRLLGGKVVRVVGKNGDVNEIAKSAAGHPSEHGISDPDYVIDNSDHSSFSDLDRQVASMISAWWRSEPADLGEVGDPHGLEIFQ